MGTKNKPGTFDCYANAHPDEPMFVLLGRDPLAADLVEEWARRREAACGPSSKVEEARACAASMRKWEENGAEGPEGAPGNRDASVQAVTEQRSCKPCVAGSTPAPSLDPAQRTSEAHTPDAVDPAECNGSAPYDATESSPTGSVAEGEKR